MTSIIDLYQIYLIHTCVQTDSRKIKKGDIFFALKGDNFNGNNFALQAIDDGAEYAVIDDKNLKEKHSQQSLILVADVLKTLQQLALHHRQQFNIPFIAITGSNGKTTTKELIKKVLEKQFITSATQGNLNNHIGIPLTILEIPQTCQVAIIEMGANHVGEIEDYCKYVLPDIGIITNCGKAHIGHFGGLENIKKAKGELFDYLKTKKNATVFICTDEDYLIKMSQGIDNIFYYGNASKASLHGAVLANNPFLKIGINYNNNTYEIQSKLVGDYNLMNLLCAFYIGIYFKISAEEIKKSIELYVPQNSRSQWIEKNGNKIILDAYNANPSSMELAIKNFANIETNKKIVFLGEMKELGANSVEEHQAIINLLEKYNWFKVILVGADFIKTTNTYLNFEDSESAKTWWLSQNITKASLLIKGSRASKMENIIKV